MKTLPKAKKVKKVLKKHNDSRIDNYYWLRDDTRKNKEVLDYLKTERAYHDDWIKTQSNITKNYFKKLNGFIPAKDESLKVERNGFFYFSESLKINEYRKYYRSRKKNSKKELILDINKLAKNKKFYQVSGVSPSKDNQLLAYAEDINGRREYTIKVRHIKNGRNLSDKILGTDGQFIWSKDSKNIIYVKRDETTLTSNQVFLHTIGTSQKNDILLFEETDPQFHCSLGISRDKEYGFIYSSQTNANEVRFFPLNNPTELKLILKRKKKHKYYADIFDNTFYVMTNMSGQNNFSLKYSDLSVCHQFKKWKTILKESKRRYLLDFEIFKKHILLDIRENGLPQILKINSKNGTHEYIEFDEPCYDVSLAGNHDPKADYFCFAYSSLNKPETVYKEFLVSGRRSVIWKSKIKCKTKGLKVERLSLKSRDKIKIPASLVYKDDGTPLDKKPILFYGYGSYGHIIDANFRSSILPLLEENFIFVLAHVRGGSEMGKHWYENGRMHKKKNTFYDFIDVTQGCLKKGYGDKDNVFAMGGSAGGLLMGAVVNEAPELYKGILAAVPFMDVVTTMLDESIPLTTFEYDEWGNPNNKKDYDYMKSYSPYDNLSNLPYPNILVTSSLFDSQVQYYEPAKYVAKLRDLSTSNNKILFRINLIGGHGGLSGKTAVLKETSEDFTFFLSLVDS